MAPPRRGRLDSIHRQPPARGSKRPPPKVTEKAKSCPACGCTQLDETDGAIVCSECFTQVAESNIVAEVTFEEGAAGRATVQGGMVQESSRHAKTLGAKAYSRIGGGDRNTLQDVQAAGRRALNGLCPRLGIEEGVQLQAERLWQLCANINFSAGRKSDEVVAACLYAACRRQRDNKILLMDIAEQLRINVFRLGEVYKDMCKMLFLNNENVGHQYLQELEPLIKKYCDKLQFADKTKIVAEDALKIIRRMNRDWIVAGRHPAGLCSACIILAARMNNFQRSVRELVYVSKVADVTIAKRVEEFRRTKSSALTVDLFREYANRIKHQHDPPSSYLDGEKERRMGNRKRKRDEHVRLQSIARESRERDERASQQPIEIPDDVTDASSRLSSVESEMPASDDIRAQKRQRVEESSKSPAPSKAQQSSSTVPAGMQPTPPTTQTSSKRKRDNNEETTSTSSSQDDANKRQRTDATPSADIGTSQQERRVDSEGFAIPALPASAAPQVPAMVGSVAATSSTPKEGTPTLGARASATPPSGSPTPEGTPGPDDLEDPADATLDELVKPKKRGRKKFEPPTIDLTQEELDVENYLELEIEKFLDDGEVQDSQTEVEKAKEDERIAQELEKAKVVAEQQKKMEAEKSKERRQKMGQTYDDDEEDLEKLFENDMEVEYCLLRPEEVKIKEQIWVAHNEDWLRKQAEKEMMAQVARATGTGPRGRKRKDGKPSKRGRKRGTKGDGSVLTESSTPIETPADAARAAMNKNNYKLSTAIDFSALERVLAPGTPSASNDSSRTGSGDQTRRATPAPSEATAEGGASEPPESPAADDDDDEDVEDDDDNREKNDWDQINDDAPQDDDDDADYYSSYQTTFNTNNKQTADEFGELQDDFYEGSGDEYE